ncbi:hypothetical protein CVT25_001289 [Psilocybe cyanescens]|uniref:Uncharacterized protein n=1 Tax=Psilocybe cyanescens TaxID=93625 RepID=A0A409XMI5_PSICY|nr:hypothetical protein CVT25_001289 [Psilocybe cyanescens]
MPTESKIRQYSENEVDLATLSDKGLQLFPTSLHGRISKPSLGLISEVGIFYLVDWVRVYCATAKSPKTVAKADLFVLHK